MTALMLIPCLRSSSSEAVTVIASHSLPPAGSCIWLLFFIAVDETGLGVASLLVGKPSELVLGLFVADEAAVGRGEYPDNK